MAAAENNSVSSLSSSRSNSALAASETDDTSVVAPASASSAPLPRVIVTPGNLIPTSIIQMIFEYSSSVQVFIAQRVCKQWRSALLPSKIDLSLSDKFQGEHCRRYIALGKFVHVREIRLNFSYRDTVREPVNMPRLQSLSMSGDPSISEYTRITQFFVSTLTSLDLSQSLMTAEEFEILSKNCPEFRSLNLNKCRVIRTAFLSLACTKLTTLNLTGCVIHSAQLVHFARVLPRLQWLSLANQETLDDEEVASLEFRELTYLNLSGCKKVTGATFEALSKRCCKLETLNLAECRITDLNLQQLVLSSLTELSLLATKTTTLGLDCLKTNCPMILTFEHSTHEDPYDLDIAFRGSDPYGMHMHLSYVTCYLTRCGSCYRCVSFQPTECC